MKKKIKILIAIFIVAFLVFSVGIALKNVFLHQIRKKIQSSLSYSSLKFSVFPLSLVIDDVQSLTENPHFSVQRLALKVSYRALLSKEKPLQVILDKPVVKFRHLLPARKKESDEDILLRLPFDVEKGLIRNGEVDFRGGGIGLKVRGIKARFAQRKGIISLETESREGVFSFGRPEKVLKGRLSLSVESDGKGILIKKARIISPSLTLRAEGNLRNLAEVDIGLETDIDIETPFLAYLFNLPFDWKGRLRGKGVFEKKRSEVLFSSSISSRDIVLNDVPLGKVSGKIKVREGGRGKVELAMARSLGPEEYLEIEWGEGKFWGLGRGVHLDPVIKSVSIPWPIRSPVWGIFKMENGELEAEVEFREKLFEVKDSKFPLSGRARFHWDGKNGIYFSSQGLQSSFGLVGIEGEMTIGEKVELSIEGEVFDVSQARVFTSLILAREFKIPEIRGKGRAEVRIFGDYFHPHVRAVFTLPQAGIAAFEVQSVEGEIELLKDIFLGKFKLDDPSLRGEISLFSKKDNLSVLIDVERGKAEKVLPGFDINFPLSGEASGRFEVREKGGNLRVEGVFESDKAQLLGQPLSEVEGKLVWKDGILSLSELRCRYYGGEVTGSVVAEIKNEKFKVDIKGERVSLSSFYSSLKGDASLGLKGEGVFGRDMVSGSFDIHNFSYSPLKECEVRGDVRLGVVEDEVVVDLKGNFLPGDNQLSVSLKIPLSGNLISADIKGNFNNLDIILPWKGAQGEIQYLAEIRGPRTSPRVKGAVDFKGSILPLPRFPHAFENYKGLFFIENNSISLRSFRAVMGGGDVFASGEIGLGKQGIEKIDIKMEGNNLLLSLVEKTKIQTNGNLRLVKNARKFVLEGDFLIDKLFWRRELNEKITLSSGPYNQSHSAPGIFDNLSLNLRLRADKDAWMENSLGKLMGKFDLTISGNVQQPVVTGDIEVLEGDFYFQDRKFSVIRGKVSFTNPLATEAYLDFRAETYVKDYRVTVSLNGPLERLRPEFASSPPLPPEDVLALLTMGEAFKRTYSYDKSIQFSTASLLSFQLLEEAKKRAEKLFQIDRFRIDPFVMGSSAETTARLTVGKKISKNFFLVYSTNISTEREELFRVEWELTRDFSIVGIRDEKGRLIFDVKIHKRF